MTVPVLHIDLVGVERVWAFRTRSLGTAPLQYRISVNSHSFPAANTLQAYAHSFHLDTGDRVELAEVTFTFNEAGKISHYHREILFSKPSPPSSSEISKISLPGTKDGKNVLIVLSHPEQTSFNHAMAATAKSTLEAKGYTVLISDLHAMGFDPVSDRRNFTTVKDASRLQQAVCFRSVHGNP